MRKILLSSTILFSISTANALTIEEAITQGYKNDEAHQQIRTVFLNEIEQFPRALANFMPKVSAEFSDQNQKSKLKNPAIPAVGGTTRTNDFSKNLVVEQPIFNGGSSVAELKAAQASFRASRAKYYGDEQKAILEEINNYVSCAEAFEKYNISKISVKSNRTQLEAMKERFRLGETTETEVASAESALAAAEAGQSRAYSDLESAKANFFRVFGIDPNDISLPAVPSGLPNSLEELTEKALKSNLDIDEANNQTVAAKSTELASKGALLPSARVRLNYGKNLFDPVGANREKTRDTLTSSLSVNVPILAKGGAEYSDVRRAKNNSRLSAIKLEAQMKAVKANCKAEWEAFMASRQTIEAAEKGVRAAEIAYSGIIQEEMLGSKTIVDVLNFEERLNKARKDRIEARKEYIIRGYRIKALIAQLTAKAMKLPVTYFEPEDEFKNIKKKIIGF